MKYLITAIVVTLGFSALVTGCCLFSPSPPNTPYYQTNWGRSIHDQVITRDRAREILAELPPDELALLNELMFIANMQMAEGNEDEPLRLYRRVETELAHPQFIEPEVVQIVLADMKPYAEMGNSYEIVSKMLSPLEGAFPSIGDCLERIATFPDDVAVAFLVSEYFADHHYHLYNMRRRLFEVLLSGEYGPRPLEVIEEVLRDAWPSESPSSEFQQAVKAGKAIVGVHFDHWYYSIRGTTYERDNW